jgi:glyoxylase-like metal-dependent hydrolase (beta-lactamase superfamily II)
VPAAEIQLISPALWVWQNYDAAVKADLWSTAIQTAAGLYLIDPIRLVEDDLTGLLASTSIAGVIVTNANHHRFAAEYSNRFSVPLFAHPGSFPDAKPMRVEAVAAGDKISGDLEVIGIAGAVSGEVALYSPTNNGTLIIGDALINFQPYGFTFLPKKYCENEKLMQSSLRRLLAKPSERILFAHGTPILSRAAARLQQLLGPE